MTLLDEIGTLGAAGDAVHRFLAVSFNPDGTLKGGGVAGGTVDSVTAVDGSVVVAGTATDPTVRTGTLDVIAAAHPPAADWSNNGHKITNVTDPGSAQDAATKAYVDSHAGVGGAVNSVTAADASVVIGGTAVDPTVRTATLDAIATAHPPAAAVPMNAKKITSLANGTASTDAAAFGQVPTTLPPSGAAGGDLAGTFPNPTIGANKVTLAKIAAAVTLDALATGYPAAADVTINSHKLTNVLNPTGPQDGATKSYVDATSFAAVGARWITNPLDYGAKGDNATDDTANVQAAINAAIGHIHFSFGAAGVYLVTRLTWKSNLRVTMDKGVIIKRKSGTLNLFGDTAALTNVQWEECQFDNASAQGDSTGTAGNMFVLTHNGASGLSWLGCKWQNIGDAHAIRIVTGANLNSDIDIFDNVFNGPATVWIASPTIPAPGVYIANFTRVYMERNRFIGTGGISLPVGGTSQLCRGLYVRHNVLESIDESILVRPATNSTIQDIDVSHNSGRDLGLTRGKGIIAINDAGGTARNIKIHGNTLRHWGALTSDVMGSLGPGPGGAGTLAPSRAGGIVVGGASTSPATVCDTVSIADNVFDARTDTGTIEDRENVGIDLFQVDGFTVEGNTVYGAGLSGIYVVGSSTAYNTHDGIIAGNRLDTCMQIGTNDTNAAIDYHTGICIDSGCEEITVEANHVRNSGNAANAAWRTDPAGIQLMFGPSGTAPPKKITVARNRSYDNRGTQYQKYGLRIGKSGQAGANQPSDIRAVDNRFDGNLTGEIKFYTNNTYVMGGTLLADSAAATTLGSVVKKVEVFNDAGTSLGFSPVYDTIT